MRYEEHIRARKKMHKELVKKLEEHSKSQLPKHVKREKLEKALEELKDYEFVPKKKKKG
ncbi:MAG: hypothetical protein QXL16_00925 [Candidatus Micrarchaeaceae archaeon]